MTEQKIVIVDYTSFMNALLEVDPMDRRKRLLRLSFEKQYEVWAGLVAAEFRAAIMADQSMSLLTDVVIFDSFTGQPVTLYRRSTINVIYETVAMPENYQ